MRGTTIDRYPGPSPYEDTPEHHRLFYGRNPEIRSLANQIIASRLIVVFGQSGLGKTSLLQAGVFRRLREAELFPISLRLNDSVSPFELITSRCQAASREFGIDYVPGTMGTAWEFFKTAMFWLGGTLVSPVVVFDQFEEIFTLLDPAWRKNFAQEIGPLISGNAPHAARERLKRRESKINDMPPKVKVVFSLREEWYGSLEELSSDIQGLFQNRFQVLPLPVCQAKEAIENPGRAVPEGGVGFSTPPFQYDPSASQMIVDFLKGRFERIEPFQLQLLCQDIEQRIVRAKEHGQLPDVAQTPIVIMPEDLGGEQAMAAVLQRFYQNSLDALPLQQRSRARELCDTGLLSPRGHRLMLQADQIWREFGVLTTTLEHLVKKRILREVPRLESIFYEISHDRLAQSILKARRRRIPRKYRAPAVVAAAVVAAFFFYVAISVNRIRNESARANNQRDAANHASGKANEARESAEELASYLIGEDLMGSIRPMGRIDVMEGVEKKVDNYLARVASQREGERSDLVLQIEGLAHLNRGDLAFQQFELSRAKSEYLQAKQLFKELLNRNSENAEWWHSLADADAKLSADAMDQLRLADARVLCQDALVAIEKGKAAYGGELIAKHQSEKKDMFADRLLRDEADTHRQIADILALQGKLTDALAHYDQTLRIARGFDENTQWLQVLEDGLNGKGAVLSRQGKNRAAEEAFKSSLTYANKAATMSPFDPETQHNIGVARVNLANLKVFENPAQMIPEYKKVLEAMKKITDWDPRNSRWRREYAAMLLLVGDGYSFDNEADKSLQFYEDAQIRLNDLRSIDDTNHDLEMDFVWLYKSWGQALSVMGQGGAGRFDDAFKILGKLGEIDPSNYDPYKQWLYNAIWKARALNEQGEYLKTIQTCKQSFLVLERIKNIDATDTEYWEAVSALRDLMGNALQQNEDYQGAEREYLEAVKDIKRATNEAASNAQYWDDSKTIYNDLAGVRDDRNDEDGALKARREKIRAVEKAVEAEPTKAEYDSDLAVAYEEVGDQLRERHEFVEAATTYANSERAFHEAIARGVKKDADTYRDDLVDLLCNRIAALWAEQKDRTGMLKAYEAAVAVRQGEVTSDPNNISVRSKLAKVYANIGDGLRNNGELLSALDSYTHAEQVIRDAIAQAGKTDALAYRNLLVNKVAKAYRQIGDTFREQENLAKAQQSYELCDQTLRYAIQLQPDNAVYWEARSVLYDSGIAPLQMKGGQHDAVFDAYQQALHAIMRATELDSTRVDYHYYMGLVYEHIGDESGRQRQVTRALESYDAGEGELRHAINLTKNNPKRVARYWNALCVLLMKTAPLHASAGDQAGAEQAYSKAQEAIATAVELDPKEPSYQTTRSELDTKVRTLKPE